MPDHRDAWAYPQYAASGPKSGYSARTAARCPCHFAASHSHQRPRASPEPRQPSTAAPTGSPREPLLVSLGRVGGALQPLLDAAQIGSDLVQREECRRGVTGLGSRDKLIALVPHVLALVC